MSLQPDDNEIEYRYAKGQGWVAGYKRNILAEELEEALKKYLTRNIISPDEIRRSRFSELWSSSARSS